MKTYRLNRLFHPVSGRCFDVAVDHGVTREPPADAWIKLIDDPVGHAVRLDAACVVVNLLDAPGHPELKEDSVANVVRLKAECERAAMPLMVEPLVLKPTAGAYGSDGDVEKICGIVRLAAELGADVI